MSKEWKAPDKVTQKMTRDGAVAENLTTGETSSISEKAAGGKLFSPRRRGSGKGCAAYRRRD